MYANNLSIEKLAVLLREAEKAHAVYEKELGRRDEEWPEWYARFIIDKLKEK